MTRPARFNQTDPNEPDLLDLLNGHDPYAEAEKVAAEKKAAPKRGRPSKVDLLISYSITLTHKGTVYLATLTKEGTVVARWPGAEGEAFDTPSAAARAITGTKANGWRLWTYLDGGDPFPIGKLRGDKVKKRGGKKTADELKAIVSDAISAVHNAANTLELIDWAALEKHARKAKRAVADPIAMRPASPTKEAHDAIKEVAKGIATKIGESKAAACLGGDDCQGDVTKEPATVLALPEDNSTSDDW